MKRTLLTTGAALLAFAAAPAMAQVAGGLTGQVGGEVSTPPIGSTVGSALDTTETTARDASRITRDTAQDAQDVLGHPPAGDVDANVGADVAVGADASGAVVDLDVQSGAMVHASDGGMLGHVADVTRDSAGRVQSFTVRTADGAVRSIPATGASVEGGAVVTGMTQAEFEAQPE